MEVDRASGRSIASARMNPKCEPFDDVRVRQAFNYAIDKDALNKAVFAGQADIAKSVVPQLWMVIIQITILMTITQAKLKHCWLRPVFQTVSPTNKAPLCRCFLAPGACGNPGSRYVEENWRDCAAYPGNNFRNAG